MRMAFAIAGLMLAFLVPRGGSASETDWAVVRTDGEDTTYFDIQFIGQKGWIVGWQWDVGGIILHTTDGGETWREQIDRDNVAYGFRAVHFQSENEGWIVGGGPFDFGRRISQGPYFLHTIDGGNTWKPMAQSILNDPFQDRVDWNSLAGRNLIFTDVYFANSHEGWLIGGPDVLIGTPKHFLFRSTDGGQTWIGQHFSEILNAVYFVTPEDGWLTPETGLPSHTTDKGETWQSVALDNPFPNVISVQFLSLEGWLIESQGDIYHTTDGGVTWDVMTIDGLQFLEYVCGGFFANSKIGWVVTDRGKILHTLDGGKSWQVTEDMDLVAERDIRLHSCEYISATGEVWALGKGSSFEPYILRHAPSLTSVSPQGKLSTTWSKIKTAY